MSWQPIETAPKGERILVTDGLVTAVCFFDESNDGFVVSWDMSCFHGATHWCGITAIPGILDGAE